MSKVCSIEELNGLREQYNTRLIPRLLHTEDGIKDIVVCGGSGCKSAGCMKIADRFKEKITEKGLDDSFNIVIAGCAGFCEQGPIAKIAHDDTFYVKLTEELVDEIIEEHIVGGKIVEKALFKDPMTDKYIIKRDDIPFYKNQFRYALHSCGTIDPFDINEYIGIDGYQALAKSLVKMSTDEVIEEVTISGLIGRGSGGQPTGKKWKTAASYVSEDKVIICKSHKTDRGSFLHRTLLGGNPHRIIEAMLICGRTIGAKKGIVNITADHKHTIRVLDNALKQARECGFLGTQILGTDFDFDITIQIDNGDFFNSDDTNTLRAPLGKRFEPILRPEDENYDEWEKTHAVHNVETLVNIPRIILEGGEGFAKLSKGKSKGTKLFALAGKVNNKGLVEVPMGTTLREVIYDIGGGIKDGKAFKAVQTNGPKGGTLFFRDLDMPIDFDSTAKDGSFIGPGGLVILDESDCIVNISKYTLDLAVNESCGKCTSCRIGSTQLSEILGRITKGKSSEKELATLKELGEFVKDCSLCSVGQTAPNSILSSISLFYDEYLEHIKDKKCAGGVCRALLGFEIDPDACIGCTICARNCPTECITGEIKGVHTINKAECIKCGICFDQCPKDAVIRV